MKTAIVCDWLVTFAGAEKVLAALLDCFPEADLFAVVDFLNPEARKLLKNKKVQTTFIQKLPGAKKYYRSYLPLMPLAIEKLNLSGYQLILSSSHAVAKGVICHAQQIHISYTHTPMRYAWDMQDAYLREAKFNILKKFFAEWCLHRIRLWDQLSSQRVDHYIANSAFVAKRIQKLYRRPATVINPPIDLTQFTVSAKPKEDFYLAASRLVPYKKMVLIAETFAALPDKKLVIIGDGPEASRLKQFKQPNITFLGYQPNSVLIDYLQRAKAFIFAALEDFGLLPVEAQATGTPVIAFGKGGALETVQTLDSPTPTGIFFGEQSIEALTQAIQRFENNVLLFTKSNCRANAERFSETQFKKSIQAFVAQKLQATPGILI